jgi:hypothetical protein
MSCTVQPVFEVKVNQKLTYLCGKCIVEYSKDFIVEIPSDHPVAGKTCECVKCR